jgi:o-succinylbenzoate synthase
MIVLEDKKGQMGRGECGPLKGLSYDDRPDFGSRLMRLCEQFNAGQWAVFEESLADYPSMRFGFEMALRDYSQGGNMVLFPSAFTTGQTPIDINGLIWMGTAKEMERQIADKITDGFSCLKLKVGAIDFEQEVELLRDIRSSFPVSELELRLDANGAWSPVTARSKLDILAKLDIHSIEQPIRAGQTEAMAELCRQSPIPIALDEELIGHFEAAEQTSLLQNIQPAYIILKPTLLGGFAASEQWIQLAEDLNIQWWITSALESNIGLNAIAQWTATLGNALPQGLGTGGVFSNNFGGPLSVKGGRLFYDSLTSWSMVDFHDNL